MIRRTWPYGTEVEAKVLMIEMGGRIVVCGDGKNEEGYIMVDADHQVEDLAVDQDVVLRFCQGGPSGGYWRVER